MESPKCINDLPNDILVEILSYLNVNDLVHCARHVCSLWREVSGDVMLWRNKVYSPAYRESDANVAKVLEQTPKLRALVMNERGVGSVVLLALVQHCFHLRKLIFFGRQRFSIKFLKTLTSNCPKIENLSIPHEESSNLAKMKVIGQFSHLKDVRLDGWEDREKTVILKPLADGCPSLQRIDLKNKMVMYEDFTYFLMKKKDQLESLDIEWESADWKCLIPPLTVCTKLKKLCISYTHLNIQAGFNALSSLHLITSLTLIYLNDADINCVINVFEKHNLKQLEELRIIYYKSYDDRLADVIVRNCPKLKVLFLKNCENLSDNSVENFHILHDLESVNLSTSGITGEGVISLTKCTKLKYLSLKECGNLTETSMKLMVEFSNLRVLKLDANNGKGLPISLFASHLPHLSLLSLNVCKNIDEEALAHLKKEKPQLVVCDDFDTFCMEEEEYEGNPLLVGAFDDGHIVFDNHPIADGFEMNFVQAQPVARSVEEEDLEVLMGVEGLFDFSSEKEPKNT